MSSVGILNYCIRRVMGLTTYSKCITFNGKACIMDSIKASLSWTPESRVSITYARERNNKNGDLIRYIT
jgi:hypothetical protein